MLSRLVPLLFIALPLLFGCGEKAAPVDGRTAMIDITGWHKGYVASHGHKLPPDEAAFVAYVEGQLKERGQPFDAAKFLVSPRDGQKYVVKYGKEFANLGSTNVVVHEKDGYDGKVYVGYQIGRVDEVDAAELPTLLQSKP
jgi:hypothetical protein